MIGRLEFFTKTGPAYSNAIANELFRRTYLDNDIPVYVEQTVVEFGSKSKQATLQNIDDGQNKIIKTLELTIAKMRVFANFDKYLQVRPRMKGMKGDIVDRTNEENDKIHSKRYSEEEATMPGDIDLLTEQHNNLVDNYKKLGSLIAIYDQHIATNKNDTVIADHTKSNHLYFVNEDGVFFFLREMRQPGWKNELNNELNLTSYDRLKKDRIMLVDILNNLEDEIKSLKKSIENASKSGAHQEYHTVDNLRGAIESGEFNENVLSTIKKIFSEQFPVEIDLSNMDSTGVTSVTMYPSMRLGAYRDDARYDRTGTMRYNITERDSSSKMVTDVIDDLAKTIANIKTLSNLVKNLKTKRKVTFKEILEISEKNNEIDAKLYNIYGYHQVFNSIVVDSYSLPDSTINGFNKKEIREAFYSFYKKYDFAASTIKKEMEVLKNHTEEIRRVVN